MEGVTSLRYIFLLPQFWRSSLMIMVMVMVAAASPVWASGSYAGRPPQPPAGLVADAQRYELGKAIYAHRFPLQDQAVDRIYQAGILLKLQEKLPASARQKTDLREFAGKLNSDQLAALAHFLQMRYRIGVK